MKLPANVTRTLGSVKLFGIKHAPEMLIGTGIVCMVGTVILACTETVKASDVMAEFKSTKESPANAL